MTQRKKQYHPKIPDYELEAIARCLLPDMQSYFESDEGKRAFAEWQAQQQKQDDNPKYQRRQYVPHIPPPFCVTLFRLNK